MQKTQIISACVTSALVLVWQTGATQAPPKFVASVEMRIDGTKNLLSAVGALEVSRSGEIVAAFAQDGAVRYFSAAGMPLGTIGRRGEGPGEFRGIAFVGWKGDSSWVYDATLRRISYISPQYTLLRTIRAPQSTSIATQAWKGSLDDLSPGQVTSSGDLLMTSRPTTGVPVDVRRRLDLGQRPLFRVKVTGQLDRLIGWQPGPRVECIVEVESVGLIIPLCGGTLSAVGSGGIALAHISMTNADKEIGSYVVCALSPTGDTLFNKSFTYQTVPILKKTRDSIVAAKVEAATKAGNGQLVAALRRVPLPQTYLPVRQIRIGRDASIWLALRHEGVGRKWLVLSGKGEVLGEVLLPETEDLRLGDFAAKTIWSVSTSPDDIQDIVRSRLINKPK